MKHNTSYYNDYYYSSEINTVEERRGYVKEESMNFRGKMGWRKRG